MAIQPIDLQTLYTQMDKVSKDVAYQAQGVHVNRDVQQSDENKKLQEQRKAIEKARKEDASADTVKERKDNQRQNPRKGTEAETDGDAPSQEEKPEPRYAYFRDPALGTHIDITG